MAALEFRLLGEVAVLHRGRAVDLGYARQRCVLAVLLVDAGRVVPVDALLDRVWADRQPRHARNALSGCVSRLRQVLGASGGEVQLRRAEGGYRLAVDLLSVDLHQFRGLVAQARATPDDEVALDRFEQALSLWRGTPFATVDTPWLCDMRIALNTERLAAVLDRNDLAQRLERHTHLLGELASWADAYPLDERLAGQFVHALYRSGRQADALRHYELIRSALADELGAASSPPLRELHRRILNADRCLAPHSSVTPANTNHPVPRQTSTPALVDYPLSGGTWDGITPTTDRVVNRRDTHAHRVARDVVLHLPDPVSASVRNDLPCDLADFAGHRTELARLTACEPNGTSAMVVHALDGMAGVGKTTLAVRAAHQLVDRYPDAQLFINLHGHTPSQPPVAPMAALYTLLKAIGVPNEEIPDDQDARAARWRAELASRKVLVLLDNAVDAAQVRPLLPGTAQSLALVTSRRRLVDLDATHVMSLDVLDEDDAVALFTGVLGGDRITDDADAVRDVVARCGHLPLAIRIAAARLRARPAWTVRHLADRLCEAHSPLSVLSAGDLSVSAALTLSYEHLDEARQRMFRLLGVHPGPDIDTGAAAALAAVHPTEASRLLESLVDDHLLQELTADRYQLHDLVRQHARTLALTNETDSARRDALRRVIDFYLYTAYRGSRLLDKQHPPINIGTPAAGCVPATHADDTAVMAWFDINHHNILAAQVTAVEAGWDTTVWHLAWTLDNFHYRRGYIHDNIAAWRTGLAATERLGDLAAQARAHRRLGLGHAPLGAHEQDAALHHLKRSLTLSEKIGDHIGHAGAHFVLGFAWTCRGNHQQALPHMTSARNMYRDLGDTKWEIRTLSMIGDCHTHLGHHNQARDYCETALDLCHQHGDVFGQANSLDSLGAIAVSTGQHTEALRRYEQALALWNELDNTYHQASTLAALGDTHRDLAQYEQARQSWHQAIDLYRNQNLEPTAAQIEQRLADLTKTGASAR
jgi:DNA-binding SARP family transcriptional activator/tetratricopeptide (TPR) repeat protein